MIMNMTRVMITAGCVAASCSAGFAGTTTIDFDDVGAPGSFKMIFPGFDNGPVLEYPEVTVTGGVILLDVLFDNSATTDPNICATCDTCNLGDTPPTGLPGLITGTFEELAGRVELDVINGSSCCTGTFTLTVFDDEGDIIGSDAAVASAMGGGSQVQHLAVVAPGIASFTVTTDLATGYTFAIDTLVYELSGPVPAASTWALFALALALLIVGAGVITRRTA